MMYQLYPVSHITVEGKAEFLRGRGRGGGEKEGGGDFHQL